MGAFPAWSACRRRFSPDDAFFNAGNVERELQAKQVSLNISEEERAYIGRIEDEDCWYVWCDRICGSILILSSSRCSIHPSRLVNCSIAGCGAQLRGVEELENHHLIRHTAVCSVCSSCFPTKRLLSLHISETHDSFFKAKVARNHPMYECLVEGCPGVFFSDKSRKQHLVDKHKFPSSFHFHKSTKNHPSQKQRQRFKAKSYMDSAPKPEEAAMSVDVDELSSAISKLTTAAESDHVPQSISFGRKRGGLVTRHSRHPRN
ncbi:zinc finger protein 511 isoform X1 [Selaginella moellendorffii]|uniref:zinc finger protein 511 isoform X1 n=1 Tax=Selaginella moellendorffii TaxID=88036 RepID=UPI000D1CDBEE|nr:zinc finger protein 511 isoform X1 [Selaginella moellendorffii]|eukprot:XP_024528883.1 zinc finger protein 511 isoform X1 [Selaginella moellendorffii]